VDREIFRRAATTLGSDQRLLEAHEERSTGLIDNIIRVFSLGTPESAYIPKERPVCDKDLFGAESGIINEIADRYNAVIPGRVGFLATTRQVRQSYSVKSSEFPACESVCKELSRTGGNCQKGDTMCCAPGASRPWNYFAPVG
jgi:hypothetical protein